MKEVKTTKVQPHMEKVSTRGLADIFHCQPDTIRRGLCVNGHYMGIKPIKLPNGRLIWPTAPAYKMLEGKKTTNPKPETPQAAGTDQGVITESPRAKEIPNVTKT